MWSLLNTLVIDLVLLRQLEADWSPIDDNVIRGGLPSCCHLIKVELDVMELRWAVN